MHRKGVFFSFLLFSFLLPSSMLPTDASAKEAFYLGSGDVLHISVWKDEALTREAIVRPDGRISFPLAGEVSAAGRTIHEVQQELTQKLEPYVPDSPVTVMLSQLRSARIYVVGKVNKPGMFLLEAKTNVMQAIALAGGLTRFADKDDICVLRQGPDGQQAIPFDYGEVVRAEGLEANIQLQSGDTVVVP